MSPTKYVITSLQKSIVIKEIAAYKKSQPSLLWRTHSLQIGQFEINTPARHQVVVATVLHDLALVKHVDDISVLDRAEAMCNSNRRAPLGSRVEGILDNAFRGRVECRGGFVEQAVLLLERDSRKTPEKNGHLQNLGVAKQGTRNSDALALASREKGSLCTNKSVEAFRKGHLGSR
jgi:hypothetical protein